MIHLIANRLSQQLSARADSQELHKAQFIALSRLIPLMYVILIINTWAVVILFYNKAPAVLTTYATGIFTIVCMVRTVLWWRQPRTLESTLSAAVAERHLRQSKLVITALSIAFPLWAFMLFPYGSEVQQIHLAFFLTVTMLGCMLCLTHVRSAVLIVATFSGIPLFIFLMMVGTSALIAIGINAALVIAAIVKITSIQNRDFLHMVNAQIEAHRRESEQSRLLRMIDDMPVAVMTVDPHTFNIDYINKTSKQMLSKIEHLLPIPLDQILGSSIDVFHRHHAHQRSILSDPKKLPHYARVQLGPEVLDLQVSPITGDDGSYLGPMLNWTIVTKEVAAENHIRQLAHYDTLTGLPNRATFREQLDTTLAPGNMQLALMFIDLDGFKLVNDTRGHRVGDMLLRQVARRLQKACLAAGTVAGRLGGDEFAVLLPDGDRAAAETLAASIVATLSTQYRLDTDHSVQIGASIGIAFAPEHGTTSEALLSRADIALYAAKKAGKRMARTFSVEMEKQVQERAQLEFKLRSALETEQGLFVFYQPIVNIDSYQVTAREALIRWHDPQRGWISPAVFVPVAEDSELIDALTTLVLHRACREAVRWQDRARVAVNVSAAQLGNGVLPHAVTQALAESGLAPQRLEIEVTETAVMREGAGAINELQQVRDMGVRVVLDDFGTGYSSLAHLRAFHFDKIKIDGSFVRDAVDRPDCAAVVKAIAELGTRLEITIVAEGVENAQQLQQIRHEGCKEVQGYLFGKPLPCESDLPMVEALNRLSSSASSPHIPLMHFTRSLWSLSANSTPINEENR